MKHLNLLKKIKLVIVNQMLSNIKHLIILIKNLKLYNNARSI